MKGRGGNRKPAPKRRAREPKDEAPRATRASAANIQKTIAALTSELKEAREQHTATADVLNVIASSPGDLAPVFDAVVERAMRLCEANHGHVYTYDGEFFNLAVAHGEQSYVDWIKQSGPRLATSSLTFPRIVAGKLVVHIGDITAEPSYRSGEKTRAHTIVEKFGIRTLLSVALRKDDILLGTIVLYRQEPRPFTDKQIELVQNFAAQAVIAIENGRLLSELRESLQRQTATADVLKVISSSPGELAPVFQAMLENATRLCDAKFGSMYLCEGEGSLRIVALHGAPAAFAEERRRNPIVRPGPDSGLGHIMRTKQTLEVPDLTTTKAYLERDPLRVAQVELAGARTYLAVPLLKENELFGAITVYRQEVRPFTDKQIELVQSFAAQAVIAIENARLLNELRQRTHDLSESLEQQTATSEVLKVISSSPGELDPVFNSILDNAVRICGAHFANLVLYDGVNLRVSAMHNAPLEFEKIRKANPIVPLKGSAVATLLETKQKLHILDLAKIPAFAKSPLITAARARSMLAVPMLKEDDFVGAINIYRQEVKPFTDKQIALLENFAAQAVIAIENTRLLSELRETLERQTATSEVLSVISSSPTDAQPVFDMIAESAARLCEAQYCFVYRFDGELLHFVAHYGLTPDVLEMNQKAYPSPPGRTSAAARAVLERAVVQIPDVKADSEFALGTMASVGGFGSVVGVPILRDGVPVGSIAVTRVQTGLLPERQIELLKTFADQAVIAIENARLFDEVQTRTNELAQSVKELQALGEVTQSVNSSVDLETVLTTIVAKATQLSNTEAGAIYVFEEVHQEFRLRATYGMDERIIAEIRDRHTHIGETAIGKAAEQRIPVQIADLQNDPSALVLDVIVRAGFRALLVVPLLSSDRIVGALVVRRKQPGEFPRGTVDLLQTFAAQSVLAIQNARLFENVETRTRELAKSLEELRTAQDRLVQTEKLASLGQLTAGIAHEIKNPLNFVNNFSGVSVELIDELQDILQKLKVDDKTRAEILELTETIKGNLDKVVQHGKRADSIVKNMLLHSRKGSGEHRPVDINAIIEESLNLAYHGARAEKQGFNITLERSLDPTAGEIDLFPQEITRVLLNLISNGFYAATKRKAEANGGNYEPTLAASTKNLGDSVEIRIRDNGTGIPPEVKEKMFNPFFTTKPVGEGTGLGLSLSYDIIVKQHAGSIEVDTQPGKFTEFRIVLPRGAATVAKSGERP